MAYATFTGDTPKLLKLVRGLEKLRAPAWKRETHRLLGEETVSRVLDGFSHSRDPYGKRWKPLKHRAGQPLLDTGRMRNAIRMRSSTRGFTLTARVVYAATHNYGRGPIPKRQFLPSAHRLPGSYRAAYVAILRAQRRKALGR
jgi:phage gpG-like protein